jgi:AraC family transcriptional regulator of adaptative response / DNA-3-methyladenine glycosylase II
VQTVPAESMIILSYQPPFDWGGLLHFLATRAIPGVEVTDGDTYRRTIASNGAARVLTIRHAANESALAVSLNGRVTPGVRARARHLFDLDADPAPIAARLQQSPRLRRLIENSPGLRVPGAWDGFELAVRAVLGQQVTVTGASTLASRLVRAFGEPIAHPRDGLSHLFPSPAALAAADLAPVGLPRARAATIRMLAEGVASGDIVLDGSGEPAKTIARLQSIPGIGEWTAQYVAMRALRDPDAFPAGDLGLRRALANGNGTPSAQQLERIAEAWRPWRAYAVMHLWMNHGGHARRKGTWQ